MIKKTMPSWYKNIVNERKIKSQERKELQKILSSLGLNENETFRESKTLVRNR